MFPDNSIIILIQNTQPRVFVTGLHYTRKNAQVATDLQTSCNKSVHKLLTRCIVPNLLEQVWNKLLTNCNKLDGTVRPVTRLFQQD